MYSSWYEQQWVVEPVDRGDPFDGGDASEGGQHVQDGGYGAFVEGCNTHHLALVDLAGYPLGHAIRGSKLRVDVGTRMAGLFTVTE